MTVSIGPEQPLVGKTELPAAKRLGTEWSLQSVSTTLEVGSWPMRVVPLWCPAQPKRRRVTGPPERICIRPIRRRPRLSAKSLAVVLRLHSSWSSIRQRKLIRGIPRASTFECSSIRLSRVGGCSPRRVTPAKRVVFGG